MNVVKLVAKKLGTLLLTVFAASLLVFFSRALVPGDPVAFLLRGRKPSPEAIAEVTAQFGLDLPMWQQYVNWVANLFHGDLGRSLQFRQDVTTVLADRLPVTLGLVVMAGTMIAIFGLAAGIVAALNRGKTTDRAILISMTGLGAIPSFVGAIVLIAVFAVQLGWFPSFGSGRGVPRRDLPPVPAVAGPGDRLRRPGRPASPGRPCLTSSKGSMWKLQQAED